MPEPSDYYPEFADRLRSLGLQPALMGALAANVYRSVPRQTTDVDFLARSLDGLPEAMEAEGYDVKTMADIGEPPHVMFIRGDGIRVDVIAAQTPYQIAALDRAVNGVLAVEDVIIHKLIAWRPRDQGDVRQILAAHHRLDHEYLDEWVAAWAVGDRWAEAQRDQA